VRALARGLFVATVMVVAAGCGSAPSGPMILSWQLADQRDCFTAGASVVEVRANARLADAALATFRCYEGAAPATVTVDAVPGSGHLALDARTSLGAVLYHGELSLDANPPATGDTRTVTLYATGAE
jgi:hypothetical protein